MSVSGAENVEDSVGVRVGGGVTVRDTDCDSVCVMLYVCDGDWDGCDRVTVTESVMRSVSVRSRVAVSVNVRVGVGGGVTVRETDGDSDIERLGVCVGGGVIVGVTVCDKVTDCDTVQLLL